MKDILKIQADGEEHPPIQVYIYDDMVIVESLSGDFYENITLSIQQAKQLSYHINDKLVRPVDLDFIGDEYHD